MPNLPYFLTRVKSVWFQGMGAKGDSLVSQTATAPPQPDKEDEAADGQRTFKPKLEGGDDDRFHASRVLGIPSIDDDPSEVDGEVVTQYEAHAEGG